MEYLSQKKGFLGLDALHKKNSKVIVVPFGLEKTVSYGGGTKNGPMEIIKASHQVELFDEELNKELSTRLIPMEQINKNDAIKAFEKWELKVDKKEY